MDETEKCGVWTYDTRREWTDRNSGISDRLLLWGLDLANSIRLAEQLADRYPEDSFEVRDYQGTAVMVLTPRVGEVVTSAPRRRKLGSRG